MELPVVSGLGRTVRSASHNQRKGGCHPSLAGNHYPPLGQVADRHSCAQHLNLRSSAPLEPWFCFCSREEVTTGYCPGDVYKNLFGSLNVTLKRSGHEVIEDLHRVCHQIWTSVGVENEVTDQVLVNFLVSGFEVYGALEPQAPSMCVALGLHSLKSTENGFCNWSRAMSFLR